MLKVTPAVLHSAQSKVFQSFVFSCVRHISTFPFKTTPEKRLESPGGMPLRMSLIRNQLRYQSLPGFKVGVQEGASKGAIRGLNGAWEQPME